MSRNASTTNALTSIDAGCVAYSYRFFEIYEHMAKHELVAPPNYRRDGHKDSEKVENEAVRKEWLRWADGAPHQEHKELTFGCSEALECVTSMWENYTHCFFAIYKELVNDFDSLDRTPLDSGLFLMQLLGRMVHHFRSRGIDLEDETNIIIKWLSLAQFIDDPDDAEQGTIFWTIDKEDIRLEFVNAMVGVGVSADYATLKANLQGGDGKCLPPRDRLLHTLEVVLFISDMMRTTFLVGRAFRV